MNLLTKYGFTERFANEAAMYPAYEPGRVVTQYRQVYKIVTAEGEQLAEVSGKFRHEADEYAKFPTVGDFVMITKPVGESNAVIHHVLTRKSIFMRRMPGVSGQVQTIAANVDIVFICMALNNNFNLNRMERYISIAWDSGAKPIILLTKADLCADLAQATAQVERVSAFCDVITLSMYDKNHIDKLMPFLKEGETAAFIGSSGVGKSTLINALLGENVLLTNETGKGDRGRHTTTGRELFLCSHGSVLIDTPGMRELGIEHADISKSFADIAVLSQQCKFRNCTHMSEPDCAVQKALADGRIDQRRLAHYFKLQHEAGYEGLSSREIENKKIERMFQDAGGMKGAKKFLKGAAKKR